jgi:hypothetical protein
MMCPRRWIPTPAPGEQPGPVPWCKEAVAVADEKKQSGGILVKVIAGVFTAVVAPVVVAVGVKWLDPSTWKGAPATGAPTANINGPGAQTVDFLGGQPLSASFTSFGWSADKNAHVKHEGVDASYFHQVKHDRQPALLHIPAGQKGCLVGKQDQQNYLLTFEYCWGKGDRPSPPQQTPRTAAVLVHANGGGGMPTEAVAVLLSEDNPGALRLMGRPDKITAMASCKDVPLGNNRFCRVFYPGAPLQPVTPGKPAGWDGTLCRLGFPAPTAASPDGWNRMMITCKDDTVSVVLNGSPVCQLSKLSQQKGRFCLSTDGAEMTFRKLGTEPLPGTKK